MTKRILRYQIIGFALLIIISWLDEWIGLSAVLLGGTHIPNYREAVFETFCIIAVAVPICVRTHQRTKRLIYLEGFLRVCAWCGRVDDSEIRTTHGICPACSAAEKRKAKRRALAGRAVDSFGG
jgi:hypothetical protein